MTVLVTRGTLVQLAEVLVAGAVVFGLLAAWRWRHDVPWRRAASSCGILVGLALVATALAYTSAPDLPTAPIWTRFATNPVPETPDQVAAGRQIYQTKCSICHGPRGRGDGPAALTMTPKPFDLTVHVPLHAEGEVLYFVSEGIPGTQMPAWKEQLSETERWQVIRFVQALAADRAQ